jgi:hypothetical protein
MTFPRSSRGEGWGEGLPPQIPNSEMRGESPSPGASRRPLPASGARLSGPGQLFFTIGQTLFSSGIKASSAGMVATSL